MLNRSPEDPAPSVRLAQTGTDVGGFGPSRGWLSALRRWWWLLAGAAVVSGGIAFLLSGFVTPSYQATTTLLVSQEQSGVVNLQDLQASERLANTFSRLVVVRPVLEDAIDRGGFAISVEELRGRLAVANPTLTELLEISAFADDPAAARDIANTVAEAFIASDPPVGSSAGVTIVERAETPSTPVSPNRTLNSMLGAVLGLMAVTVLVMIVERLDDTVKSPEAVSELAGLPTLGQVQRFGRSSGEGPLPAATHPHSPVAEAYRGARTQLLYALGGTAKGQTVLMTSSLPREGKTTTVANLAIVLGLAGSRVIVVDCDLRRPAVHRAFKLPNSVGLTNALLGREPQLSSMIQRTAHRNVWVMTSGAVPSYPSELLGMQRMTDLLTALRAAYDIVLLDSPPLLRVTDAAILAGMVDTTVLVLHGGKLRTNELRVALERLAQSGTPIAGVILNQLAVKSETYYGSYEQPGRTARRPTTEAGIRGTPEPTGEGTER